MRLARMGMLGVRARIEDMETLLHYADLNFPVRCTITSFILSSPFVRTCIGCTRKAFLPPSSRPPDIAGSSMWYPEAGQSWIVEELLEALADDGSEIYVSQVDRDPYGIMISKTEI